MYSLRFITARLRRNNLLKHSVMSWERCVFISRIGGFRVVLENLRWKRISHKNII